MYIETLISNLSRKVGGRPLALFILLRILPFSLIMFTKLILYLSINIGSDLFIYIAAFNHMDSYDLNIIGDGDSSGGSNQQNPSPSGGEPGGPNPDNNVTPYHQSDTDSDDEMKSQTTSSSKEWPVDDNISDTEVNPRPPTDQQVAAARYDRQYEYHYSNYMDNEASFRAYVSAVGWRDAAPLINAADNIGEEVRPINDHMETMTHKQRLDRSDEDWKKSIDKIRDSSRKMENLSLRAYLKPNMGVDDDAMDASDGNESNDGNLNKTTSSSSSRSNSSQPSNRSGGWDK